LTTVKWLEHNVTYVAKNIEMDLRYITWIDHDRGASFVSTVSQYQQVFTTATANGIILRPCADFLRAMGATAPVEIGSINLYSASVQARTAN